MKPAADLKAALNKIRTISATSHSAEAFLDPLNPLHADGEPGQKFTKGDRTRRRHRPDGFGEIVRPPTEFVRIVKGVGKKLCFRGDACYNGAKGFRILYGAGYGKALLSTERKVGQNFNRFCGASVRVVFFRTANVVKKSCNVPQQDHSSDCRIRNYFAAFRNYQGPGINGYFADVNQTVSEIIPTGFNNVQNILHQGTVIEKLLGESYRPLSFA